jgi:putative ABC transport system permease protein
MKTGMVYTLALRNFIHDRVSLIVTLVGIVFSVVLMAIQIGLYYGSQQVITSMIDHAGAQLWITPIGAQSFDDSPLLKGGEKYAALSRPGVAAAIDVAVNIMGWKRPDGGSQAVVIVGTDPDDKGLVAWNMIAGSPENIYQPNAVIADKAYLADLQVKGIGDSGEINDQKAVVVGITDHIRSFTTLPYLFTTLTRARTYMHAAPDQSGFVMVRIKPDAQVETVRADLQKNLRDVDVLTNQEFLDRSVHHWLFATGAGAALIAGAVLGLIVGIVVVAQTLYASTKDHLNEFATLRALGASSGYIIRVILVQAVLSAIIGYLIGMAEALAINWATRDTQLVILLTPMLALSLFLITLGMCVFSAISAIVKVTRIDPAMVFSR